VQQAYAAAGIRGWVAPFLVDMGAAYAHADLVISRAGASTIAELARCGKPAVLIPYPHAGGHQRVNASVAAAAGGAVVLEEAEATPERMLTSVRRVLADERSREAMGERMRALSVPGAAEVLADAVAKLVGDRAYSPDASDVRGAARPGACANEGLDGREGEACLGQAGRGARVE
jgi:UDP-N-acetylglucosamine--N-acetylmuramyl-(pentapeptide) pyrophosphoryl-undecaprenol N-acetylglucosamine transferase